MAQQRNTGRKRDGGVRSRPRRILATLPDAVGAQSVIVAAGTSSKPVLALLLLKIGEGITDATVIACHDRNDAAAVIQEYQPLAPQEMALEMGRTLIAAALHDGAPAEDWPEAARRTGLTDLRPRALAGRDWLRVLDPDGARLTGGLPDAGEDKPDWADRHPLVRTWEEDLACLIDAGADPEAPAAALREQVYPAIQRNRALWRDILLRAAAVLRDSHDDWHAMALNAAAFDEAGELRDIPAAQAIAKQTVHAFQENPQGYPTERGDDSAIVEPGPPAEPGELERLLARAGVEADAMWLDGYLTACELAPEPTNQQVWANDLIAGEAIRADLAAAKRLVDLALQRFETLLEALEDPDAIRASVAEVADTDLAAWARGFVAAGERIPGAWPADSMRAEDRRWLDALAALARDGTPIADRPALAGWLAWRAEITDQADA